MEKQSAQTIATIQDVVDWIEKVIEKMVDAVSSMDCIYASLVS